MKSNHELIPFTPAEQMLLDNCRQGETAKINTNRPLEKTDNNVIRGEFLRCLAINKDNRFNIDPKGLRFSGAWVTGELDLNGITTNYPFHFSKSVFDNKIILIDADIKTLDLEGCLLIEGLRGDRAHIRSSIMFREGFESKKDIRLIAAEIDGSLVCKNGKFQKDANETACLHCNRVVIHGSVYMNKGFTSIGKISFNGAKIDSDMKCHEGTFTNPNKCALSLHSMYIAGSIYFDHTTIVEGNINLSGSYIDSLVEVEDDDSQDQEIDSNVESNIKKVEDNFWDQDTIKYVYLDGFKYNHIYGLTDAKFRIKWLNKIPTGETLNLQPWKQLSKVLRDMGHDDEADYLMIAFHDKKQSLKKDRIKNLQIYTKNEKCSFSYIINSRVFFMKSYLYYQASYFFKLLYSITSKYGYRPMRTLFVMLSIWLIFGLTYWYAAKVAIFAPSNPLIFINNNYSCKIDTHGTPWFSSPSDFNSSNNWYYASPGEYTTFQPIWYSLDIILPVVDLQMEKDWGVYIPTPSGNITDLIPFTSLNHTIRFMVWIENILGWILSLILIAILSGLAKNEKE